MFELFLEHFIDAKKYASKDVCKTYYMSTTSDRNQLCGTNPLVLKE